MKRLLVLALVSVAGAAMAQNGFYNGDTDGVDGWTSQQGTIEARIYEDFQLGSATTVNTLFGNFWDSTSGTPTAYWEIRQGVVGGFGSPGSGGTLIASGINTTTVVDQNISYFGYEVQRYTLNVASANLTLASGTYWMTIAPVVTGSGQTYIGTTSGVNQTGGFLNDNLAVADSTTFAGSGETWANGRNLFGDGGEVSYGLTGTPVPEPASIGALAIGALALIRRRRSARK